MPKIRPCLTLLLVVVLCISGCATSKPSAQETPKTSGEDTFKPDKEFVRMIASTPGGNWYPMATKMATLIEREIPGVSVTVMPGSGKENTKAVSMGDADMGWTQTSTSYLASKGQDPFDTPYPNMQHLLTVSPQGLGFVVRADSNIRSISDLKDKRIGFGPAGYECNYMAEEIFQIEGFTLDDIKKNGGSVQLLGLTDGPEMLADKHIDVYVCIGTHPYQALSQIEFNPGIRLLPIGKETREAFYKKFPNYSDVTLEKGTYSGQEEDIVSIGNYGCLIIHPSISEEFAYRMVKAILGNLEEMKESSPIAKRFLKVETALQGAAIEPHPGILKYLQEQGIPTK